MITVEHNNTHYDVIVGDTLFETCDNYTEVNATIEDIKRTGCDICKFSEHQIFCNLCRR